MTFINQKEEVLDIQLTSHGKKLLSLGKFDPQYYSFSDADVLYDSEYVRISDEQQKDIFARITQTTPRLKLPIAVCGAESNIQMENKNSLINEIYSRGVLSNSEVGEEYLPALDIRVKKGNIASTDLDRTGSFGTTAIPKLNMDDVEYIIRTNNSGMGNYVFGDDSGIKIEKDYLLFSISEENGTSDGFSVSFYEVEEETINGVVHEKVKPFNFIKPPTLVKNNILLDESEIIETNNIRETENTIGYYFDVLIDDEIADGFRIPTKDIYTSNVTEEDVDDVC